ncbi:MAG TPA: DNA polymerase III subunit delta, partial [Burkholderiaceae bacterium]|nr:DNA polymerase III subunit delta [Burkholderiaceae bacterium]
VASIERAQLPQGLSARLARQKQSADAQALDFMAERVEGNLLAAAQELAKLALLYPEGELTLEQVADSVLDVARYDVFKFADTVLAADSRRALKQLEGLRAEASPLPLVLWTLHEQVRNLLILQEKVNGGQNLSAAARALRLWGREALFERALRKLRSAQLVAWLDRCGQIEKLTKGLHPTALCDDPWAELARLAADIAGSLAAPAA